MHIYTYMLKIKNSDIYFNPILFVECYTKVSHSNVPFLFFQEMVLMVLKEAK